MDIVQAITSYLVSFPHPCSIRLTFIDSRKSVGIALFCFAVYVSGIVSVEVVEEEEDEEEYEEHDQQGHENEKEPLVRFFPFPFTEEQVYLPPYPLGSPERAAYIKLYHDKKRQKDIRGMYRILGARGLVRGIMTRPV